jgi:endo-1,4-beta-xylanase
VPTWSRRDLLSAGAALAALASQVRARDLHDASLHAVAQERGLSFGSALSSRGLQDPDYVALITAQCGVIVAENEFKMPSIQPEPGVFRFDRAERLLAFAEGANLKMRGHTLLWHHPRWVPRWLATHDFGAEPATAAAELLTTHIRKTTQQFGKRVYSWDVVNEAVDNITGEMRETRFSKEIGTPDQVIELAFRTARAELPEAELVYNDYMGWEKNNGPHRDGVLKLLERMRRKGVPINALGIQGHIGSGNQDSNAGREFDARDERAWYRFLKEVTGMGYRLLITEFDVHDATLEGSVEKRDARVAELGGQFLDVTLAFREVTAVLCWGLSDKYSWLHGRTPRVDGQRKRPTPFDEGNRPKPLVEAMAKAFRGAPKRTRTDITGQVA